jgi:hypothetical protein
MTYAFEYDKTYADQDIVVSRVKLTSIATDQGVGSRSISFILYLEAA